MNFVTKFFIVGCICAAISTTISIWGISQNIPPQGFLFWLAGILSVIGFLGLLTYGIAAIIRMMKSDPNWRT
jgi:FtsH-binding integral membrane protein